MDKQLKDALLKEYMCIVDEMEQLTTCIDNSENIEVKRKLVLKYFRLEMRGLRIRHQFWRDKNAC